MTPLMTEQLVRDRRRELLDSADHYRLGHELRRPVRIPTRLAVLALVWLAEAVASHLDQIAERARRSAEDRAHGVRMLVPAERHRSMIDATATCSGQRTA
jgi:hypothetical protein